MPSSERGKHRSWAWGFTTFPVKNYAIKTCLSCTAQKGIRVCFAAGFGAKARATPRIRSFPVRRLNTIRFVLIYRKTLWRLRFIGKSPQIKDKSFSMARVSCFFFAAPFCCLAFPLWRSNLLVKKHHPTVANAAPQAPLFTTKRVK